MVDMRTRALIAVTLCAASGAACASILSLDDTKFDPTTNEPDAIAIDAGSTDSAIDAKVVGSADSAIDATLDAITDSSVAIDASVFVLADGQVATGLAVNDTTVFWTNQVDAGSITKYDKDSGMTSAVATSPFPMVIAATDDYFAEANATSFNVELWQSSNANVWMTGGGFATSIYLSANAVYWTNNSGHVYVKGITSNASMISFVPLIYASTGCTSVVPDLSREDPTAQTYGVFFLCGSVLYHGVSNGTVMVTVTQIYSPAPTIDVIQLAMSPSDPFTFFVTARSSTDTTGSVYRVVYDNDSGTGQGGLAIAESQPGPDHIATFGNYVYWINDGAGVGQGQIVRLPIDAVANSAPHILAQGQNAPLSIAVDATYVYWTNKSSPDASNGTVNRIAHD
jgi:hypothetical protein